MQKWKKEYKDLGGSVVDALHHSEIQPNEFSFLRNWIQEGTSLVRRNGIGRITRGELHPYEEGLPTLTTVFPFRNVEGTQRIIAFGTSEFGIYDESLRSVQVVESEVSINPSLLPWFIEQYNAFAYATRKGQSQIIRFNEIGATSAGIPAPETAAVLADGGAGGLSAADYSGVYTFYNVITGAESDYSPVSNILTLGATKQIAWSGIGVSTTGQVTWRRLYRSLPNQPGIYFFIANIEDNTTTTYTDNKGINDMGEAASSENGLPPENAVSLTFWRDRLWVATKSTLHPSRRLFPESFDPGAEIQIDADDGHEIRGIAGTETMLVVGKTNKVFYIAEAGDSFVKRTLSERDGLTSGKSLQAFQDGIFWRSGSDVLFSSGSTPKRIGDTRVRKALEAIPATGDDAVTATIWPKRGWYLLSIPQSDALDEDRTSINAPSLTLCFNYRTSVWSVLDFEYKEEDETLKYRAPYSFTEARDDNFGPVLYCTFGDRQIYQFDVGNRDKIGFSNTGQVIRAAAVLQEATFDGQMIGEQIIRLRMDNPETGLLGPRLKIFTLRDNLFYTPAIGAFPNLGSLASRASTPNLKYNGTQRLEWLSYSLRVPSDLTLSVRPGIYYDGVQPARFSALVAEGVVSGRRPWPGFTKE